MCGIVLQGQVRQCDVLYFGPIDVLKRSKVRSPSRLKRRKSDDRIVHQIDHEEWTTDSNRLSPSLSHNRREKSPNDVFNDTGWRRLRIRSIQVHRIPVHIASAGQSCTLAVEIIDPSNDVLRVGMALVRLLDVSHHFIQQFLIFISTDCLSIDHNCAHCAHQPPPKFSRSSAGITKC